MKEQMREKIRKDKKGFTLVELIVVLVILGILIALLVPSLTGYIDKARKKAKLAECRQVVVAAQTRLSELYGSAEGQDTGTLQTAINSDSQQAVILKLSETPGKFSGQILVQETAVVKRLVYVAKDGTQVIYEKDHEPEYWVEDGGAGYSSDAPGYSRQVGDLDKSSYAAENFLDENGKLKDEYKKYFSSKEEVTGNESRRLQVAYMEKYGEFPVVDWGQITYPDGVKGGVTPNAKWKPIATSDGGTILVADSKNEVGAAQGAVVYYDGNYYYHNQFAGKSESASATYISDKKFSAKDLLNEELWTIFNK